MSSRARLSRRTTLACAVLAPLTLAACDIDPPRRSTTPGTPATPPDADSVLVASVITAIAASEAVVAAVRTASPALRPSLRSLAKAHAAHRQLLAGAAPDVAASPPDPVTVPQGMAGALSAVRSSEQQVQRVARRACLDASSGDLARVLASLAASSAQHVAALGSGRPPAAQGES